MKCNKCSKQATFHITDLTGDEIKAWHLCPECAKEFLNTEESGSESDQMSSVISQQLSPWKQTTDELQELDSRECPVCGISFFEFRQGGRLGCPHDYIVFESELEPLLANVHGDSIHIGKQPKHGVHDTESQTELIRFRREMKEAIEKEDYETASSLRDRIREIENKSS